jgi:hypothetical protein
MTTPRLHLIVRQDLPPGEQAVQAAHALRQFTAEHPEIDREWFERSNTLALLAAPDESALNKILDRAFDQGFRAAAFREPDLGGSLTAIAIEPAGARICRSLPLALRRPLANIANHVGTSPRASHEPIFLQEGGRRG